jgi:hypothetical protein
MKHITFAIYQQMPIACEGNDDIRHIKVVNIRARASKKDITCRAEKVAAYLSRRLNSHAQVWNIA